MIELVNGKPHRVMVRPEGSADHYRIDTAYHATREAALMMLHSNGIACAAVGWTGILLVTERSIAEVQALLDQFDRQVAG